MKKIGKGCFTTAYLLDSGKVLLKSTDPIKECMSLGWFPNSELFPVIEPTDKVGEYLTTYYPKTSSLKTELEPYYWMLYKHLKWTYKSYSYHECTPYSTWFKAFTELSVEYPIEGKVLLEALDACSNYSNEVSFESSPRNVRAVNGKLLLLDCFFIPR